MAKKTATPKTAAKTSQKTTATTKPSTLASRLQTAQGKADCPPHLIVEARAGTGKTTTLIEGLKLIKGIPSALVPSPQQAAVWEQMQLSHDASSICFVAFNKSIATELQRRVPEGCNASTMHSMGLRAVTANFGRLDIPRDASWVVRERVAKVLGMDVRELMKTRYDMLAATCKLVSLCKMNLVDASSVEDLQNLAAHYEIELNGSASVVFDTVPKVLALCRDPKADGRMDYDDMIWLPVALGLPVIKYDLLLVDEAQDLNRCQQALARKAGTRLILVGDPKQAIYGFAGADSESMPRLSAELSETPAGCVTLPLTVTRRCGKAIVAEAQKYVPDFAAFDSNPEGTISRASYEGAEGTWQVLGPKGQDAAGKLAQMVDPTAKERYSYHGLVQDGDMLLCRVNAPLVSQCFRFLKAGRKAYIQGKDVGAGLISTIKKLCKIGKGPELNQSIVDLISGLSEWLHSEQAKENAKRMPAEARLIALQDRYDCLSCFCEDASTVDAVIAKIEAVFSDADQEGIRLSSVHKAKGLEAHRVFILQPKGATMPHPMAKSKWQREQEFNLLYVAITRAINELVYVS
jgi:DNA helicase-2/ATP-dependent DNA helicase PcrA